MMEASGGGRGSWSYRRNNQQTQSGSAFATISSSSASGTIVSTTYTSGASRVSSVALSVEADMLMDLEIHGEETMPRQEMEERMTHIQSLVQEFFAAAPSSSNCFGDMSVLERWFTELGFGWVLHLDDDINGTPFYASETASWIRAFTKIMQTINMAQSWWLQFFKDEPEAERGTRPQPSRPSRFRFEMFFEQALLKMLIFVDVAAQDSVTNGDVVEIHAKLRPLLQLHFALSDALWELQSRPAVSPFKNARIMDILFANKRKARVAIWSGLERIRTRVMGSMGDSYWGAQTAQASSDIHMLTRSVVTHITFLLDNDSTVEPILDDAARLGWYESQTGGEPLLSTIITEMMTCLEEKIVSMSKSFSDQSLVFLFLLNNFDFILNSLPSHSLGVLLSISGTLTHKVNGYMESYLQVSWAPLLSCLLNPTPLRLFWKYHNPLGLPKFESDFQKTFTAQRLWKVPDPRLRKSLRTAITEKIIPVYTKYIENNKVTNPKFTPKVAQEMLEELFEG